MTGKDILQKWQLDFDTYFEIYNTFVLDGFIDDLQPYMANINDNATIDNVEELSVCEYFERLFRNTSYKGSRNLLIIYDPTEAVSKRFNIRSEFVPEDDGEAEDSSPYPRGSYPNSMLAQHFYDILRSEEIDNTLIDHDYNGASPDFAKIHYAISENDRLARFERVFADFFDRLISAATENNHQEMNFIFVVKMIDRLKTAEDPKDLSADELGIFRELLTITQAISNTSHKLIILADKNQNLPKWLTDENENNNIKYLHICKPSDRYKEFFFDNLIEEEKLGSGFMQQYNSLCVLGPNDNQEEAAQKERAKKRVLKKFLAYSNDFSMRQLKYYDSYLDNEANKVPSLEKLQFSLQKFKIGELKNPWDDDEKVRDILNILPRLQEKLKGQDLALLQVQNILRRSTIGLDRIDNPDAPRVILFLAGPTGTGKTEVCKQIAEIIFGSADRVVRFDMSEYHADASDQKLFGAPPGYVGYEEGGKLTNAILKEPFSLVLFDEIEKAHDSILDKFLQILSDGRLTSGKGETVYFTDSIIVITSNAGVTSSTIENLSPEEEREKMGMDRPTELINMKTVVDMENEGRSEEEIYEAVSEYLRYFVKFYFVCKLNRPELYGRIEDSIVYYNYIGKEAVRAICRAKVKSYFKAASDKYLCSFDKSLIEGDNELFEALVNKCSTTRVREMGARGIGKAMNSVFNGSLSNYITDFVLEGREQELRGATLYCEIKPEVKEELLERDIKDTDIVWSKR